MLAQNKDGTKELAGQYALFELTDQLYRARSLSEAYERGLDGIVKLLGTERASILQFDLAGVMRFVGWRGLSDNYRKAVDGHSPWTPGSMDPEPIFLPDIDQSNESEELKKTIEAEGIRGLGFVPLTANRHCVGKFMTYYAEPHTFTESEKQLSLIIARQLSYCIERQNADFSASRLRALIGSSGDAIVAKDLNGVVQHWNRGAERIFGYTSDEMVGQSITILIPQERLTEETEILGRIRQGESVEHYETVRRRKDGSEFYVSLTVSPIFDVDGKVVGASKIARDITEQQRARERQDLLLREMNHRVKNLFAVTSSIINLSSRTTSSARELAASLNERLSALGRAHALTMANNTEGADAKFSALAKAILEPYQDKASSRIIIKGNDFSVPSASVTPVSLLLHELGTNAAKYGSLSVDYGQVEIQVDQNRDKLGIIWKETGGPMPDDAHSAGFGSRLMEATALQLGATLDRQYLESGLVAKIQFTPS